jgi:diaminopimelate epimerase
MTAETVPGSIPWVKISACGNDFLIIEGTGMQFALPDFTRQICDRHTGVGADGVEWLFATTQADIQACLINADGSEAEISGNGTRCVAAYLFSVHGQERIAVLTGAGVKICAFTRREGLEFEFETGMGVPRIGGESRLKAGSREAHGIHVDLGNPHFVVFVDAFSPSCQADAAEIQRNPVFEHGVNVEFVRVVNRDHIEIRLFERGVGETKSSGTGSCASAVAAAHTGRTNRCVRVSAPGGDQFVRRADELFLRGPARLICRGEYFL